MDHCANDVALSDSMVQVVPKNASAQMDYGVIPLQETVTKNVLLGTWESSATKCTGGSFVDTSHSVALFVYVLVCLPGTFGYDCEQRCACSEPGQPKACHHVTGTCSCLPGLTGVMCDTQTMVWTYICRPFTSRNHLQFLLSISTKHLLTTHNSILPEKSVNPCEPRRHVTFPLGLMPYNNVIGGVAQFVSKFLLLKFCSNCYEGLCLLELWSCKIPLKSRSMTLMKKPEKRLVCKKLTKVVSTLESRFIEGTFNSSISSKSYHDFAFRWEACPPGLYGPNCAFECACQNGAECNAKDGSCICPPGFYGASCSEGKLELNLNILVCPSGRYGTDCMKLCDCQNGAICSPSDGKCECRPGWMGEHCEKPCEQGFHGKDCLKRCDCANGMHCDPSDGECICPPGKRGAKCDQDCEAGHFGAGCRGICACANGGSCDGVTGACKCTPGWRGKRCDRPCPDGRYGEECRFICDCATSIHEDLEVCQVRFPDDTTLYNPFVARCDHVTGDCRCPPGWTGPDCGTPCPPGR
ncbi:unnamed protein product [Cylicostephanus goldi]|uniref:EGF-like domain-containing protein n=1 Tax=Cylicostephanus goldi TaxID=71465 RepID=A0A3P7N245_CYLGO|nr:unnamed protein product [Cylicostephanus goldi]